MLLFHSESLPHYGLDRFFEFAREAGFDGVEISVGPDLDSQNADYLKKLEKRHKIEIKAFSLTSKGEERFLEAFQNVTKEFPRCALNLNSAEIMSFRYKNWLKKIVPRLAKKYDLKFNRKNMPFKLLFGILPGREENSLFSLRESGDVCLDLSALWASKEEVMRSIRFLGGSLKHVYLSNVQKNVPYAPPQNGLLPLESFLTRLAQEKYRYDFTLKLNPKTIYEGENKKMIETLQASIEFYQKYFVEVGE